MDAIVASHLTKEFEHGLVAVNDVSFRVPQGGVAAFLGPNGAGKTTTIRILTTLLAPTSGAATVAGYGHGQIEDVRRSLGIVFQDPSLDDELTADENLRLHAAIYGVPSRLAEKRIADGLALVELADRRHDFAKNFSGGMKRRLEIARALVHDPAVLFLDEPTVGLDPQTRNRIWEYVRSLKDTHGTTVLFTTHYMEEAEKAADVVFVIDRGRLVATGTVDEIKAKAGGAATLEEAFLALTGSQVREEEASGKDAMRAHARAWGRR